MNANGHDFDELVDVITSNVIDKHILSSLNVIANSTESSQKFVRALVTRQSLLGARAEDAVAETMRLLEKLAGESEQIACVFMKCLQPFADDLQLHDIYEAIDLWIFHCSHPHAEPSAE